MAWLRWAVGAALLALPVGVLVPAAGIWTPEQRPWVSLAGAATVALATAAVAWAGGRLERWESESTGSDASTRGLP